MEASKHPGKASAFPHFVSPRNRREKRRQAARDKKRNQSHRHSENEQMKRLRNRTDDLNNPTII